MPALPTETKGLVSPELTEAHKTPREAALDTIATPRPAPKPPAAAQGAQQARPTSLASQVNKIQGAAIPPALLAKMQARCFNTRDVVSSYFHCILYSETDARKSTTAALFGSPAEVRIILNRNKEQLYALKKDGYIAFPAENANDLRMALMYPEALWPDWAALPNRTLVLDDITQCKDMLLDDNETNDETGREFKDQRLVHREAKSDMRDIIQLSVLKKPMNFVAVALQNEYEQGKEVRVFPDLPQKMRDMLTSDFEYVLYIRKGKYELVTSEWRETFLKKDDKGKEQPYQKIVFAKHKMPRELEGTGLIKQFEPLDLKALWDKVRTGKVEGK